MLDVLDELVGRLNRHDVEALSLLLTPGARVEMGQLDAAWVGPAEIGQALRQLFAAVPDFAWSPSHRYVGQDEVTEEGVWTGQHTGSLAGQPASGQRLSVRGRALLRQAGGQVCRCEVSIDVIGMRLAMGVPVTALEAASTAASITAAQASDTLLVRTAPAPALAADVEAPRSTRRKALVAAVVTLGVGGGALALALAHNRSPAHRPAAESVAVAAPAVPSSSVPSVTAQPSPELPPIAGVTSSGHQLTLSADVLFDVGDAQLTPRAQQVIARVAVLLAQRRPRGVVLVRGYTDSTGLPASNLSLSLARARAVVAALQQQAVAGNLRFLAQGLGSLQPVASNATATGRALNRRVTILLPPS